MINPAPPYNAGPAALAFHADRSKVKLIRGPFRSGKSVSACHEIFRIGCLAKKTRWIIIRNTLPELKDTTQKTFFEWFPPGQWGRHNKQEQVYYMQFTIKGRSHEIEILFRSFDRPEQLRKALGLEITGFWIDEAREIPRAIIMILLGRMMWPKSFPYGKRDNYYLGILTTNPFPRRHYLFKDFVSHPIPGFKQFFFPQSENEHNLPKGYYKEQRKLHADDPEWIKVYLDGEYGSVFAGKAVYPDFLHRVHVADGHIEPVKGVRLLLGFDFGMITSACSISQVTPHNWLILQEILQDESQGDFDAFMDFVIEELGITYPGFTANAYCGTEGPIRSMTDGQSCIDIMVRKGLSPAIGAKSPVDRQGAVAKMLRKTSKGKFAVQIDPRCTVIIDGFTGGYERKEVAPGVYGDDVVKNIYSHIQDSLQAVATCVFNWREQRPKRRRVKVDSREGVNSVSGL